MVDTFQAIAVFVLALVPGSLYFWAFERQTGRWGVGLSDRVLRFVGASALFHVAFAPASYWLWANEWPKARDGEPLSLWLWALALLYAALPLVAGSAVGFGTHRNKPWARLFAGPHPAPRAWDFLFECKDEGWVLLRLKSGVWVGGAYGRVGGTASYNAVYPESQDLFLAAAAEVDAETGEFMVDEDGDIPLRPGGLLVRWDEVEYLEFIDA
jgi:hypothetical protein